MEVINMSEELIKKIASDSGKDAEIIKDMATQKKADLNDMVTMEGALALIAKDLNVDIKDEVKNELNGGNQMTEENTNIKVEEENAVETGGEIETELSLDDLGKKFLPNPKVGDTIEFTLMKIKKSKDIDAVDRDGEKFKTNLTSVDYKMVYVADDGAEFSPKSWEVVGKINAICKKLRKISGIQFSVKHIKDGMKEKIGDNYVVKAKVDGDWKILDRKTKDWI
jgi:hypothetical protein